MGERIVFASHNSGLGDALIYSTLPERWVREQGAEVFITGAFRNPGVAELVWKTNPFVSGIVQEPHTHQIEIGPRLNVLLIEHGNNIAAHEAFFSFVPKNLYPRLYWTPGVDRRFLGKVVLDPSGITTPFTKEAFEEYLIWLRHWGMFKTEEMILLEPPEVEGRQGDYPREIFPEIPRYKPADIFETATIIHSCRIFATNESGGAALASAIKGAHPYPQVIAVMTTRSYNTLTWKWENLKYHITSKLTPDY